LKITNRDAYDKYGKTTEEKTLLALSAIQGAVGAQFSKFSVWYGKFLMEHPYYRSARTTFKAISASIGGAWKAMYFFWRPRGGYKKHLSRSKNPFTAINQNLGAIFVQTMPRLDAIMIYTKATAMAIRDLSSHITGKRYPMMDPSKLGGSWSLAGGTMSALRWLGKKATQGAKSFSKSLFIEGSDASQIAEGAIGGAQSMLGFLDDYFTAPGKLKDMIQGAMPGAKENKRLFGGLTGTGGEDEGGGQGKPACIGVYICGAEKRRKVEEAKKKKDTKQIAVQTKKEKKKKDKYDKIMIGHTAKSAKYLQKHDKREKRRSIWKFFGAIGSGVMSLLSGVLSFLSNPYVLLAGALATVGTMIVKWFHANITPKLQGWVDKQLNRAREIGEESNVTGADIGARRKGDVGATSKLAMQSGMKKGFNQGDLPKFMQQYSAAFIGGRYEYMAENILLYGDYTADEIADLRIQHFKKFGTQFQLKQEGWRPDNWNAEDVRKTGRAIEAMFLSWLTSKKRIGDEDADSRVERIKQLRKKYGKDKSVRDLDILDKAEKHKEFTEKQKAEEKAKGFSITDAHKWASKNGGKPSEYLGKTLDQAKEIAKKYGSSFVAEVKATATITAEKAQELSEKYGGPAAKYMNKTLKQAIEYGKTVKDKAVTTAGVVATITAEKAQELSEKYGGPAAKYMNRTLKQAIEYGQSFKDSMLTKEKVGELRDKAVTTAGDAKEVATSLWVSLKNWLSGGDEDLKLIGPKRPGGDDLRLIGPKRHGSSGYAKEILENISPERKSWIRRNADRLFATGVYTAEELKKLGATLSEKVGEAGEKVGNAVNSSAAYTSTTISNAVSNVSNGGGGGNNNPFISDQAMTDVMFGHAMF